MRKSIILSGQLVKFSLRFPRRYFVVTLPYGQLKNLLNRGKKNKFSYSAFTN